MYSKSRRSRRKLRRRSRRPRSGNKSRCRSLLSNKIAKNTREYKSGRYVSRQQGIAVSYSQIRKRHPECNRYTSRKR